MIPKQVSISSVSFNHDNGDIHIEWMDKDEFDELGGSAFFTQISHYAQEGGQVNYWSLELRQAAEELLQVWLRERR